MQGKAATAASSSFSVEHPPGNGHAGPSGNGQSGPSTAQSQSARADSGSAQPLHMLATQTCHNHACLGSVSVSVCMCLCVCLLLLGNLQVIKHSCLFAHVQQFAETFFFLVMAQTNPYGNVLPVRYFHNMTDLSWCLCSSICKVWNMLCCMQCRCKCLNFTVDPLRLTSCSELKARGAASSPPCANSPGGYSFPKFQKLLASLISARLIGQYKKTLRTKYGGNMGLCCLALLQCNSSIIYSLWSASYV